ncbi:GTP-binding protein [Synechococcus sp. RSCCF101]|uniref:GTP-binding protein n=1 Tax=Synechococcus sp. RSCCF101 TaxID=2511069 RepID=UPI00124415E8|nr:GTP-binding protein [Synechococcus sp. RSCCF101]QEY33002.1 GTP-binding protein [Synechococcus sp. RSCCF101]
MTRTVLITGPPGCGKTTWILQQLRSHTGSRGYIRLEGTQEDDRPIHADDGGIDLAVLQDQCDGLRDGSQADPGATAGTDSLLVLIERPQFQRPSAPGLDGMDPQLRSQLQELGLVPDQHLHFGRDPELPAQDTLDFTELDTWSHDLSGCVWDASSLSSFWFELVNGAYGDVYRAKALMNLPDGRGFFFNWMVSQNGSQYLPLESVAPPHGRPGRLSRLVVQGRGLDPPAITATIEDCLLSDAALELQQAPLRDTPSRATPST